MSTQESYEVWQCNHCGHVVEKEEEVTCWKCGKGEMIYQGQYWREATPLPHPETIPERISGWWKKYSGEPDDPNGLGHNLFQLIFWSIVLGLVIAALALFG